MYDNRHPVDLVFTSNSFDLEKAGNVKYSTISMHPPAYLPYNKYRVEGSKDEEAQDYKALRYLVFIFIFSF